MVSWPCPSRSVFVKKSFLDFALSVEPLALTLISLRCGDGDCCDDSFKIYILIGLDIINSSTVGIRIGSGVSELEAEFSSFYLAALKSKLVALSANLIIFGFLAAAYEGGDYVV